MILNQANVAAATTPTQQQQQSQATTSTQVAAQQQTQIQYASTPQNTPLNIYYDTSQLAALNNLQQAQSLYQYQFIKTSPTSPTTQYQLITTAPQQPQATDYTQKLPIIDFNNNNANIYLATAGAAASNAALQLQAATYTLSNEQHLYEYMQQLLEEKEKLKELYNEPFNIILPASARLLDEGKSFKYFTFR